MLQRMLEDQVLKACVVSRLCGFLTQGPYLMVCFVLFCFYFSVSELRALWSSTSLAERSRISEDSLHLSQHCRNSHQGGSPESQAATTGCTLLPALLRGGDVEAVPRQSSLGECQPLPKPQIPGSSSNPGLPP
jgi:hypothetical protein